MNVVPAGAEDRGRQQNKAIVCPRYICDWGTDCADALAPAPCHVCLAALQHEDATPGFALSQLRGNCH